MKEYIILWTIIAIVALVTDIITSSFLFIWFTIGGIIAIIFAIIGFSFSTQLICFIASSVILMAICYPYVKKVIKKTVPVTNTMERNYIGKTFICDKDVDKKATIKYEGIYWTVINEGEFIHQGDKVKIVGIDGNRLVIKKEEN